MVESCFIWGWKAAFLIISLVSTQEGTKTLSRESGRRP